MADGADALTPPVSWAYWAWDAFKGPTGVEDKRWGAISRSYPMRISGQVLAMRGGGSKTRFELEFRTSTHADNRTTCWPGLSSTADSLIYFAPGMENAVVTVRPKDAVAIQVEADASAVALCNRKAGTRVTLSIEKQAQDHAPGDG